MKNIKNPFLSAFIIINFLFPGLLSADIKAEFQQSYGYTDNLYVDTSYFESSYEISKLSLKYYPLPYLETKFQGDYTYYFQFIDLSNFSGTADFTLLPLKDDSKFLLYLNGGYTGRSYHKNLSDFNAGDFKFNLGLGYDPAPRIQLRTGFSYKNTNYNESEAPDEDEVSDTYDISRDTKSWEIFAGINFSIFGSNTLDLETGFEKMDLEYVSRPYDTIVSDLDTTIVPKDSLNPYKNPPVAGNYDAFYLSARYSRPLGNKFGFNIVYTYRKFFDIENMVLPRLPNEFLSPWVAFYEGESIAMNLKTFIIPHFTLNTGIGYWNKDFFITEVGVYSWNLDKNYWQIKDRKDEQYKFYIGIKRTFNFKTGISIDASLQFDYTENESTNRRYYYNSKGLTFGVIVKI
jgi:hypothetical protein